MNNNDLNKYRKRLLKEAALKAAVFGLSIGLFVGAILAASLWAFNFTWFVALPSAIVVAGGAFALMFFKFFKITTRELYSRVDNLGLEQRVITSIEYADNDSYIAQKLREDTSVRLAALPPKNIKLKMAKWPFIVLGIIATIAIATISVQGAVAATRLVPHQAPQTISFEQSTNTLTWDAVAGATNGYYVRIFAGTAANPIANLGGVVNATNLVLGRVIDGQWQPLQPGRYRAVIYTRGITALFYNSQAVEYEFRVYSSYHIIIQQMLSNIDTIISNVNVNTATGQEIDQAVLARVIFNNFVAVFDNHLYPDRLQVNASVASIIDFSDAFFNALDGRPPITVWFRNNNPSQSLNAGVQVTTRPTARGLNAQIHAELEIALNAFGRPALSVPFNANHIPLAPTPAPLLTIFGGWTLARNDGAPIGTREEPGLILEAVDSGVTEFFAYWLADDTLSRMLRLLRERVNRATVPASTRDNLLSAIDDLETLVWSLDTAQEQIDAIREFQQWLNDYFDSYPYEYFVFCANYGAWENGEILVTVRIRRHAFRGGLIPPPPEIAPEYGLFFWGWEIIYPENWTPPSHWEIDEDSGLGLLSTDMVLEAIAYGALEFSAVWGDAEVETDFDDDEDSEDEDESDLESDMDDIIDDALEDMEDGDPSTPPPPPPDEGFLGDNVIDGDTPFTTVLEQFLEQIRQQLADGNISDELRAILERYLAILG